jgi:hypothetical protein
MRSLYKGSLAKLYKNGKKKWFLDYKGKTHPLPRRASFDHAEKILAKSA